VKRAAIFVHRWLGVALCSLFLLWFPSGIVMMYWDFPSVTAADRLQRLPALDPSRITLAPSAVVAPGVQRRQLRVSTFDGRPVYRTSAGSGQGAERVVFADSGEDRGPVSSEMRDRAAAAWARQPVSAARVDAVDEVDQWTVQGALRTARPLWKYSWPDGQQIYVSGSSGEVVQYTTTASRVAAYFGAIPHWLYFTPLRKNQAAWSRFVIWSSGIGAATALLGIVVGLWMYVPAARMPYAGQKQWHLVLGLVFGIGAVTWAFSGMLSMDPFPASAPAAGRIATPAFRERIDASAFDAKPPAAAILDLGGGVKELELTSVGGRAVYIATLVDGGTRIVPVDGEPFEAFSTAALLAKVMRSVEPAEVTQTRLIDEYDRYYLDRHGARPLPVMLVLLNDADQTRFYIDPKTARVVGSYSARSWTSRWLYHGLHSLDFPWLYGHRPAWDLVVLTFMLGGTALCVTSVILAWQVVKRSAGSRGSSRRARAGI